MTWEKKEEQVEDTSGGKSGESFLLLGGFFNGFVCLFLYFGDTFRYGIYCKSLLLLLIAFIKRYSLLSSRLTALLSHVIPNEKTVPFL